MSRRLAMLAALVLAGAPLSVVHAQSAPAAAPGTVKADAPVTEAERKAFRDGIDAGGAGETFEAIREFYPTEYMAFETDVILASRHGASQEELLNRTFTFSKGIRERVMPYVKRAPSADLIAFGREQLELMDQLRPSNPRMCYEYVELGGPSQESVSKLQSGFVRRMGVHNGLQFKLAAKGQAQPADRTPPSKDDYAAVIAVFTQAGGDKAWLQAVATAQPRAQTDDARCQAAMTWLKAILSMPEDQAARLLAQ